MKVRSNLKRLTILLIFTLALAACSGAQTPTAAAPQTADPSAQEQSAQHSAAGPTLAVPADGGSAAPVYAGPAWAGLVLTDARTGENFTLADFAGKTVFVHPMATWCSNCRSSQRSLRDNVYPVMDPNQFVFISLSVESGLANSTLADYAADNNFPWLFTVVTPELLAELTREFGATVSNPPSQPHFIIRPDGSNSGLLRGQPRPDALISDLNAANGA